MPPSSSSFRAQTVEVDGVDAAIAPVNYCGGEEFTGLFPLHLSRAHREDDREMVGYAAPSELIVMASGIPATFPDTALIHIAEIYGNVTLVQRSRPDGYAPRPQSAAWSHE